MLKYMNKIIATETLYRKWEKRKLVAITKDEKLKSEIKLKNEYKK